MRRGAGVLRTAGAPTMSKEEDDVTPPGSVRPPRAAGALRWLPPVSLEPRQREPPAATSSVARRAFEAFGRGTTSAARTERHAHGIPLGELVASGIVALVMLLAICAALHLAGVY